MVNMLKRVLWEGSSKNDLMEFSEEAQDDLGYELHLWQIGESGKDSKKCPGIPGTSKLWELFTQDKDHWYRCIVTTKVEDTIYVLHCFTKKSNQINKVDIQTISTRYKALMKRLKNGKK